MANPTTYQKILDVLRRDELTTQNFTTWKDRIHIALIGLGIDHVLYAYTPPPPMGYSMKEREEFIKWMEDNRIATTLISESVSPSLRECIQTKDSAKANLDRLEDMFKVMSSSLDGARMGVEEGGDFKASGDFFEGLADWKPLPGYCTYCMRGNSDFQVKEEKKQAVNAKPSTLDRIRCFRCGEKGHVQKKCTANI